MDIGMANRLANESSLYLRQHADNPVDWWPYCDEAFEEAKRLDKPVLISIGYSACHWCHVMAHQSFEDKYIAGLMNAHFINIKVDREERPDVDQIYMDAVQMINQHGGWPLNIFCLSDGRPFFGGTYFPPDDNAGHQVIPWPQLLMRISEHYKRAPGELAENADSIVKNIAYQNNASSSEKDSWDSSLLIGAAEHVMSQYDAKNGGFGGAPKFPPSLKLGFLLSVRFSKACEQNATLAKNIDQVIERSLIRMGSGGLFDQVGGGFSRYAVDSEWKIPHFEKMLYDNALLLDIYSRAHSRYRNPFFEKIVEETIDWLSGEMEAGDGSFYSAIDADSEGVEGKFYVWKPEEVSEILGSEASAFCELYDISEDGNFENGYSNPVLDSSKLEERDGFAEARAKLLSARKLRVAPGKDKKRVLSWNCLLMKGLASAAFEFDNRGWLDKAISISDWIEQNIRAVDGALRSVHYDDSEKFIQGYLDDYVFYSEALLMIASRSELYIEGSADRFLALAIRNIDYVMEHFRDDEQPGYYFTSDEQESRVIRRKDWFDNATPTANSALVHVFSSLYTLTGEERYSDEVNLSLKAYNAYIRNVPQGITHALAGLTDHMMGVAILKVRASVDMNRVKGMLSEKVWRKLFIKRVEESEISGECQLCVGTQCLSGETLEAIEESL